jgi:hypothetical protein
MILKKEIIKKLKYNQQTQQKKTTKSNPNSKIIIKIR